MMGLLTRTFAVKIGRQIKTAMTGSRGVHVACQKTAMSLMTGNTLCLLVPSCQQSVLTSHCSFTLWARRNRQLESAACHQTI